MYRYPCRIVREDDGTFTVSFPDVPEALTCGKSHSEAIERAEDALSVALTFYLEEGQAVPTPGKIEQGMSPVGPHLHIALKVALADAMRERRVQVTDLAKKLGADHKTTRRILDPGHATKTRILGEALKALGKRPVLSLEEYAG